MNEVKELTLGWLNGWMVKNNLKIERIAKWGIRLHKELFEAFVSWQFGCGQKYYVALYSTTSTDYRANFVVRFSVRIGATERFVTELSDDNWSISPPNLEQLAEKFSGYYDIIHGLRADSIEIVVNCPRFQTLHQEKGEYTTEDHGYET